MLHRHSFISIHKTVETYICKINSETWNCLVKGNVHFILFYFIYFLYSRFLLVIHFIHISVYMSIPIPNSSHHHHHMLAFSHVMLKWDCSTFNFIRSIPSHGYILLRFPCSFIPTLLCLLFSKQGMVRFTPVSRSFIQKLNEICPSTELRGTIYVTFLFLLSSIHSCGEVCARVCVCVCVCMFYYLFWTLFSNTICSVYWYTLWTWRNSYYRKTAFLYSL